MAVGPGDSTRAAPISTPEGLREFIFSLDDALSRIAPIEGDRLERLAERASHFVKNSPPIERERVSQSPPGAHLKRTQTVFRRDSFKGQQAHEATSSPAPAKTEPKGKSGVATKAKTTASLAKKYLELTRAALAHQSPPLRNRALPGAKTPGAVHTKTTTLEKINALGRRLAAFLLGLSKPRDSSSE